MHTIFNLISMTGKSAVITGAGGHVGSVIAETLSELNAQTIFMVDSDVSSLDAAATRIKRMASTCIVPIVCDLTDGVEREKLILSLCEAEVSIDVLVNNAAFVGTSELSGWAVKFEAQSLSVWRDALELNLTAPFHLAQGLSRKLSSGGHGSIINIGSIYGELGPDWRMYEGTEMGNPAAYAASKGGLLQLTRWMATTLAPGVRVNAISPGGILRGQDPGFIKRYIARTPLGRMATEEDLKGAIGYLATNASSYVTGQVLRVDGGWSSW